MWLINKDQFFSKIQNVSSNIQYMKVQNLTGGIFGDASQWSITIANISIEVKTTAMHRNIIIYRFERQYWKTWNPCRSPVTLYDTLNYSNFHFIKIRREREREKSTQTPTTGAQRPTPVTSSTTKQNSPPRPQLTPFSTSQGKIPITTPTSNQMA